MERNLKMYSIYYTINGESGSEVVLSESTPDTAQAIEHLKYNGIMDEFDTLGSGDSIEIYQTELVDLATRKSTAQNGELFCINITMINAESEL